MRRRTKSEYDNPCCNPAPSRFHRLRPWPGGLSSPPSRGTAIHGHYGIRCAFAGGISPRVGDRALRHFFFGAHQREFFAAGARHGSARDVRIRGCFRLFGSVLLGGSGRGSDAAFMGPVRQFGCQGYSEKNCCTAENGNRGRICDGAGKGESSGRLAASARFDPGNRKCDSSSDGKRGEKQKGFADREAAAAVIVWHATTDCRSETFRTV